MVKQFKLLQNKYFKELIKKVLKLQEVKEILMVSILVNFLIKKDMAQENLYGTMDKYFKGNGDQALKMDSANGLLQKETIIKGNGN